MATSLYSLMCVKGLNESKRLGKCRTELHKLAKRIKAGECIPEPIVLIEKVVVPVSIVTTFEHIMRIKSVLKAKSVRY